MKKQSSIASFEVLESRTLMSASLMSGTESETHTEPHGSGIVIPAPPTNLAATTDGSHVNLTWTDNSNNETGFVIFRADKHHGLKLIGSAGLNATSWTDTTATDPNDVYVIRAYGPQHTSPPSNKVSVKIDALVTVIAPRKLRTQAVSTTAIKLAWGGDFGATNGYIIERRLAGTTDFMQVGTTAAGTKTFLDTGLTAATRYEYRITAVGPVVGHNAVSAIVIGQTKVVRPEGTEHTTSHV